MSKGPLSELLSRKKFPALDGSEKRVRALQLRMLRIQQGIWHSKRRAIIVFEGFDAAGKGGAIRRMLEALDPRGYHVHPIGAPHPDEQGRHYLYRFWKALPEPGMIAVFDRSWYGRVLVERVERLTPKDRWKEAYGELNEFEAMLVRDGIDLVKIFFAITPQEQLRRFEDRLHDPYKQWKLGEADLRAHAAWEKYVKAADDMLVKCDTKLAPWNLIPADSKAYARVEALECVTRGLGHHGEWMAQRAETTDEKMVREAMRKLRQAER